MSNIEKEELKIIDKIFSWCASSDELVIIKKAITDVKNGKGLYQETVKCQGDLSSFKSVIADYLGLNIKASIELARALWHMEKHNSDRERMSRTGIKHGTWYYNEHICQYPCHSKLNGKKFTITKGAKIGLFKKVYPGQAVGCSCFISPVMPF